ncbi:MAG: DUF58 domain-containing protein [Gemmatirosa sp.]|nr:DUF58 domain-containing protein [Gemmatirosa sp.]
MASLAQPRQSLLDPKVLASIGGLEIVARGVVDGFLGGVHRSPTFGATTDFAEHRTYLPGDDPRRVDWRLYGRTDRLHVKEFEADANASVGVLLDVSRSMDYASGGRLTKLDYGRVLAASLLWLARRQRDRVGLVTFDASVRELIPPSGKHLPMALHALEGTRAGGAGDLAGPLRAAAEHFRRRGIVVVISDLYAEPEVAVDAVAQLRGRGNELLLLHVLDPAERELPADDTAGLEDLETGERLPVVPKALRAEYRALVAAHLAALERLCGERGVTYALFETGASLDATLARFLAARERVVRIR